MSELLVTIINENTALVFAAAWFEWVEKKRKTHKQIKCPHCGLWAIWVKREESVMTDKTQLEAIADIIEYSPDTAKDQAQQILDLCQPDIRACERITVIAIKYCPKDHHDWDELKRLSYKIIPSTVPGESE